MIESGIQQLAAGFGQNLKASTAAAVVTVQQLLGNPPRFYPVLLPENVGTPSGPQWPCATYQVISDIPEYILAGHSGLETVRLQVDAWSGGPGLASYASAKNIALAIRKLLAGWPATSGNPAVPCFTGLLPDGSLVAAIFVANSMDTFEQDARAYRTSTDFEIHFYPGA